MSARLRKQKSIKVHVIFLKGCNYLHISGQQATIDILMEVSSNYLHISGLQASIDILMDESSNYIHISGQQASIDILMDESSNFNATVFWKRKRMYILTDS
jgi:hypothetical protein